ncbi:unnamed protein product, partial [Prorocentrum cordatum]
MGETEASPRSTTRHQIWGPVEIDSDSSSSLTPRNLPTSNSRPYRSKVQCSNISKRPATLNKFRFVEFANVSQAQNVQSVDPWLEWGTQLLRVRKLGNRTNEYLTKEVVELLMGKDTEYKEAWRVKVRCLPTAPFSRGRKQGVRGTVSSLSGRPEAAFGLIREVESNGATCENLADCGDFDAGCDLKSRATFCLVRALRLKEFSVTPFPGPAGWRDRGVESARWREGFELIGNTLKLSQFSKTYMPAKGLASFVGCGHDTGLVLIGGRWSVMLRDESPAERCLAGPWEDPKRATGTDGSSRSTSLEPTATWTPPEASSTLASAYRYWARQAQSATTPGWAPLIRRTTARTTGRCRTRTRGRCGQWGLRSTQQATAGCATTSTRRRAATTGSTATFATSSTAGGARNPGRASRGASGA